MNCEMKFALKMAVQRRTACSVASQNKKIVNKVLIELIAVLYTVNVKHGNFTILICRE
jgi:hypothetical protein